MIRDKSSEFYDWAFTIMFSFNLSSSKTRQITHVSSPPFRIAQKILFACLAVKVTCGLRADVGAKTSDTTLLFLVYSTAEYWSLVCSSSTCFIYNVLNDALRVVTECLGISPTDHLPVFSNLQLSELYK